MTERLTKSQPSKPPGPPGPPKPPKVVSAAPSGDEQPKKRAPKSSIEDTQKAADEAHKRVSSYTPEKRAELETAARETIRRAVVENRVRHHIPLVPPFVVRDLAAALNIKPFVVIYDLMEMNVFASLNCEVSREHAELVCKKHSAVLMEAAIA